MKGVATTPPIWDGVRSQHARMVWAGQLLLTGKATSKNALICVAARAEPSIFSYCALIVAMKKFMRSI